MRHTRGVAVVLALALVAILVPATTFGQGKKKKDDTDNRVGTIWAFTAVDGSDVEKGQFRVYQKEVFKGARKVGYIEPKGRNQTTMVITDFARLNGTTELRKTGQRPPVWEGVLKRRGGSSWNIKVEVKDR